MHALNMGTYSWMTGIERMRGITLAFNCNVHKAWHKQLSGGRIYLYRSVAADTVMGQERDSLPS